MTITFWGVRGSTPTTGTHTCRYGGNTSCVSVETPEGIVVLDAGTGIRALGRHLADRDRPVYVLLSHLHLDHVQGFPYFAPLYEDGGAIHVVEYRRNGTAWSPLQLLDGRFFPVRAEELPVSVQALPDAGAATQVLAGLDVDRMAVNHPGGAYGYRLRDGRRSVVYVPDNELSTDGLDDALAAFCRGADVLVHDAQYAEDEIGAKFGWGHSTPDRACDLAVQAGVRHLVLFHHDPDRSDAELDQMQTRARARLAPHGITCAAAYEGLSLQLD